MVETELHEPIDVGALERWIGEHVDGAGPIAEVRQFTSGKANLTYLVSFSGGAFDELVVRRPPRGTLPKGGHDMARESFVLERLWRCFPLAPRGIAYCDDPSVIGAPFLAMERKTGVVIQDTVPKVFGGGEDATSNRKISMAVVDALARLHLVDPSKADMDGFGRPSGFLRRQVSGWTSRMLDAGYDDPSAVENLREWLLVNLPDSERVAILHNDWRLDNIALSPADPSVCTAVFDWDMCTRGDPLADLGTLLSTWYRPGESVEVFSPMPTTVPGFLSPDEAVGRYGELTGISTHRVHWYLVFGTLKMASILNQIHARWKRGETEDERFATFGDATAQLIDLAHTRKQRH